ncbi:hypothetical protein [Gordonia amicalis]|uniref:hypothetical protein n=1 Tax=Gordonia amicalis TaxID=89053 RepID=UPI0015F4642F|nr:hypothetical protein [Gordonia amicalis]MBA5845991.1 hypothetical protein [Gordonia amicalis]UOG21238.1 hypothetical protein MTX80_20080 [Gordonia amicalis]
MTFAIFVTLTSGDVREVVAEHGIELRSPDSTTSSNVIAAAHRTFFGIVAGTRHGRDRPISSRSIDLVEGAIV